MKQLTREQVEGRKAKAARFVETVLGDPDRADEIRDESVEDYAARRKFEITNPGRSRGTMAAASKRELEERVRELEEENENLQDTLDRIADIAAPEEEDEDEAGDDEDQD